jgi:dimeric dUTPase (all-alpha-NTP-PPase superfamily)
MQKELDKYIETKRGLSEESLLERKLLAFQIELAELANETRSFKFWSEKEASPQEVILEEYVDGIHFLLSIGIEYGYDNQISVNESVHKKGSNKELVETFFHVMENILLLKNEGTKSRYEQLFQEYLKLGSLLEFQTEDITRAYMQKNEVNHQRQDQGY